MPQPIPTLEAEWQVYHSRVYPDGFGTPMQHDQIRLAFFSGAFVTIGLLNKLTDLSEDEAVVRLELLAREAASACARQHQKISEALMANQKKAENRGDGGNRK